MNFHKNTIALGLLGAALSVTSLSTFAAKNAEPKPLLSPEVVNVYKAPTGLVISESQKKKVIKAVEKASEGWREAFNKGDAKAAASFYEEDSVTTAIPFGIYMGEDAAEGLWEYIIGSGFKNVEYMNTKIEVISSDAAVLSASWKMNKAYGVITKELWVLQDDGTAKLRVDDFEVVGSK